MWNKFKELFTYFSVQGIKLPFVYNPETGKPSVTLLFAYVTFILALFSTIALHFYVNLLVATVTSICFWVIALIFYRIGRLDKAKFDLDDNSFELDSDNNENNKEEKNDT